MDIPSHELEADEDDVLAAEVSRTPAGLRVETSEDDVYTFRCDPDADGDVWIADVEPPSAIITILEYEGYEIADGE